MKLSINLRLRKALLAAMFASVCYSFNTASADYEPTPSFPYIDENTDLQIFDPILEDWVWVDSYADGSKVTFNDDIPDSELLNVLHNVDVTVYCALMLGQV